MKTVKIDVDCGDSFEKTYKHAESLADPWRIVEFIFNGVKVTVTHQSTYDECYKYYTDELDYNYKAYQESPEGKRQAAEQERRRVKETFECVNLIERLPSVKT